MHSKSPARSKKTRVRSPGIWLKPKSTRWRRSSERRWRCSSATSNAFSVWDGCDYVGRAAQMTNSSSPPPPKPPQASQAGYWRNQCTRRTFLHRSKREKPGARATSNARLSATATRCFSTESTDSLHQYIDFQCWAASKISSESQTQ